MNSWIVLLLLATVVSAISDRERSRLAMENPDLFQGDILGFDPDDRNVIPYTQMRWTNRVIPYVIDSSLSKAKTLILSAIQDYHRNTCLRFVPRTNQRNYIKIFSGQGCYSNVGMLNRGEQPVSLGPGCLYKGTVIHELGHAIGFFHEQNRSDRDKHLVIYWQNIRKGMESQFKLLGAKQNILITPFDHDSIMLYGNYAFSKDGRSLSMAARNGQKLVEPRDKKGLSRSDIKRIKTMYKCQ